MVVMHVKVGDESQFLFNTSVSCKTSDIINDVAIIYNGRLKVSRICSEMEEMAKHGTTYPPEILGLTEEQVEELKLKDEWGEKCVPHGGWELNKDPIGRRNGKQPNEKGQEILRKTIEEAKAVVSKKKVQANVCMTQKDVQEALDMLKGATMIVYPMGLPPHEPIRQELENTEDLSGTQASREVIDIALAQLWFSGKEILRGKELKDYVGANEKTKITVKLTAAGRGPPGREPVFSEEEKKKMMLDAYRRQEELKPWLRRFETIGCF
ncbi:UPF0769 protein C21orf59 homolog isoform X3 [Cimex lectularius]|uniref:Cilia- and flagella-associated protein 298 n=1 Tax=Cimex lectularius TaxID=79782 RepID=A0A8I6TC28_CIMLE|nr:UPF0769 protein C21orf59 homolog isoform X3 [Cimex lectularius]